MGRAQYQQTDARLPLNTAAAVCFRAGFNPLFRILDTVLAKRFSFSDVFAGIHVLGRLTAGAVRPGWPHPSWAQGWSCRLHHLGWKLCPLLNLPTNSSALILSLLQAEGNQQQQLNEQFRITHPS